MTYVNYRKIDTDATTITRSEVDLLMLWPSKQDLSGGRFTDLKTEHIVRNAEAKQRFQKRGNNNKGR